MTKAELERAKRSLCNSFAFSVEAPNQLADFLGYYGMLGCQNLCRQWSTTYRDMITAMQADDLQRLAQKYLSPEQYIVTSLIPQA